jgi:hypothetical protein
LGVFQKKLNKKSSGSLVKRETVTAPALPEKLMKTKRSFSDLRGRGKNQHLVFFPESGRHNEFEFCRSDLSGRPQHGAETHVTVVTSSEFAEKNTVAPVFRKKRKVSQLYSWKDRTTQRSSFSAGLKNAISGRCYGHSFRRFAPTFSAKKMAFSLEN